MNREEAAAEIDRLVGLWNDTSWDGRCVSCEAPAERVAPDDMVDVPTFVRAIAYAIPRKDAMVQSTFAHREGCKVSNALSEAAHLCDTWGFEIEPGRVLRATDGGKATYLLAFRRKPE